MKSSFGYIYYHLISFSKLLKGNNPEDSATLYISWILIGIILPPSMFIIFLFGKDYKFLYYIFSLFEGVLIHKLSKRFLIKRINLILLTKKYHYETLTDKIIGQFVVVLLLVGSPILGFFLLTRF